MKLAVIAVLFGVVTIALFGSSYGKGRKPGERKPCTNNCQRSFSVLCTCSPGCECECRYCRCW